MSINRFFKRKYSLMSRIRGVVFLCFILLMSGCGGEESVDKPIVESVGYEKPINNAPMTTAYFPTTLGSRWVYRNTDGSEWTREVSETEVVNRHKLLLLFSDNPPLEDNEEANQFLFVKAPSYIVTSDQIFRPISLTELHNKIGKTVDIRYNIRKTVNGIFNGFEVNTRYGFVGSRTYEIHGLGRSDFRLLTPSLAPGVDWKALDIRFSAVHNIAPQRFSHSLEAHLEILAKIGANRISIVTPAGTFEDCLEIQYYQTRFQIETKEFTVSVGDDIQVRDFPQVWKEIRKFVEAEIPKTAETEFRKAMPNFQLGSLWLAPGVGPVKIQDSSGISELIAFEVKNHSDQRLVASSR